MDDNNSGPWMRQEHDTVSPFVALLGVCEVGSKVSDHRSTVHVNFPVRTLLTS